MIEKQSQLLLVPAKIKKFEQENDFAKFVAILQTEDYIPLNLLEKYHPTGINKPLRYRHIDPEKNPASFMGVISELWMDEGQLWMSGLLEKDTKFQLEKIEEIKEGILDSVSAGILLTHENNEYTKLHILEGSLTPFPKCKECKIVVIENEEQIQEYFYPNISKPTKDGLNLSENTSKIYEKLEKLEKSLVVFEERDKLNKEKIDQLTVALSEVSESKKTLESQLNEEVSKSSELGLKIEKMEADLQQARLLPKIAEVLKFEKLNPDTPAGSNRSLELKAFDENTIDAILGSIKRVAQLNERGLIQPSAENAPSFENISVNDIINQAANFEPKNLPTGKYKEMIDKMIDTGRLQ